MKSTSKHEPTVCPRCERLFVCRVGSINQCQCQAIQLTDEQRQYIAVRYPDCLCADCLTALRTEYNGHRHQQRIASLLQNR